jgi:histidinol dehydrogenase
MIRRIDLRSRAEAGDGAAADAIDYRSVVPRAETDVAATLDVVRPIVEDVRHRGVEAVLELSARFDGVQQDGVAVPAEAIQRALEGLEPAVRAAL